MGRRKKEAPEGPGLLWSLRGCHCPDDPLGRIALPSQELDDLSGLGGLEELLLDEVAIVGDGREDGPRDRLHG